MIGMAEWCEESAPGVMTLLIPAKPRIVRSLEAGSYLESFLWSAVAAVLAIRAFLAATGYPQIGGGGLHIAHMLWGGLLMLAALVLTLSVMGQDVRLIAAILGGIGFGTFIDELGKFITSDNDYFFQPTIALIYVIFIAMFLVFREIERRRVISPAESLANAADVIVDAAAGGASYKQVTEAIYLLDRTGTESPVAEALRQALHLVQVAEEKSPSLVTQIHAFISRGYDWLVHKIWFQRVVVLIFIVHALIFVAISLVTAVVAGTGKGTLDLAGVWHTNERSFAAIGELIASMVSSLAAIVGVIYIRSSRRAAYRWFKRSILLSIFFVQFFLFYENQLGALGGLAGDLLLLAGLNVMLLQETARQEARFTALAHQHR